jgi:uncharacterized Zn-binding protein involved in type VI secretion
VSSPIVRTADPQVCPASSPAPHAASVLVPTQATVLVQGVPAARLGDPMQCAGSPAPNAVAAGSATVQVEGVGVARTGDATAHGGALLSAQFTVLAG